MNFSLLYTYTALTDRKITVITLFAKPGEFSPIVLNKCT